MGEKRLTKGQTRMWRGGEMGGGEAGDGVKRTLILTSTESCTEQLTHCIIHLNLT